MYTFEKQQIAKKCFDSSDLCRKLRKRRKSEETRVGSRS